MNAKQLLTTASLLSASIAIAGEGVTTHHLGNANAMVRIDGAGKYLILPVQESMPDSKIDILVNGKVAQTLYVRLADNQVDYTVPLDVSPYTAQGKVLLNVIAEGDRAHSRNASEYICWDQMVLADTFDIANREKYRPAYHHTPLYGWMNDPNGMVYKDGKWHLYYQHNPYGSKWQNMTWGHSVSDDLVHWRHCGNAIEPTGLGTVFSGSGIVDKNNTAGFGEDAVIAIFTSAGVSQVQSLAYSNDNGCTFTFYDGNPIIPNQKEARDPNMFWHEPSQQWVLVLAEALEHQMLIFTSPNLKDWTPVSSFGKGYGCQEGVWECPDLFELPIAGTDESRWVLLCNINPGGPYGGSATQYFIGDFDGTTFTCETAPSVTRWMDYGKDNYATVSWSNAPDGRRTAIGWMSNWEYANDVPTQQYRSANTLPRELGLMRGDDGEIYLTSIPSPEVETLRESTAHYRGKREMPLPELCEIEIVYSLKNDPLELVLKNEAGENVVITLDAANQKFVMDRTKSGLTDFNHHFPAVTTAPIQKANTKGSLRLFIDRCSIEAFDGEGDFAMTNLVFPTMPYSQLEIASGSKGANVKVHTLNPSSI
ncbi:MAG: DUF4980 domain-containing protein [Bacteroidales bacterium]|nr:DUF4980 domain-containing protein [Bacteroidales bacterium]